MRRFATSVGFISHQSAKIHITPVWTLFPGIPHQRREYTSADANPHVDAVFWSPSRASSNFRICRGRWGFTYFSLHSRAHFGTESPSRRCVFPSHESMSWVSKSTRDPHSVCSFGCTTGHDLWSNTNDIKTSQSPSRRSIRRAPTPDEHRWQHDTTTKPAVPHLDARFHKYPLETNISGSTPHQHQPSPIWTLDSTSTHSRRTSVAAHHMKTSHSPSRRSISQAPSRDAHQWHDSTSKPAFPN